MPRLTAGSGSVIIDDGVYEATLLKVEEVPPTPRSPDKKNWLKWLFLVYDNDAGQELSVGSSLNFGPTAKARGWVESMLGRKLELGEEIDTDDLTEIDCQVVVKNDPETGFARIENVMGAKKRPQPQAQKKQAPRQPPRTVRSQVERPQPEQGVVIDDDDELL